MSTVTPRLGLVKPASIEQFSLALYNSNLDIVDSDSTAQNTLIKSAPKVIGIHGPSVTWGTLPTTTSDLKFLYGSLAITTDPSGYAGIDMPASFTSGYTVVGMHNGDDTARPAATFHISTGIFTNLANRFYIRVYQGTSPVGSSLVRLNYLAIGH